jgi:hypothetical protein
VYAGQRNVGRIFKAEAGHPQDATGCGQSCFTSADHPDRIFIAAAQKNAPVRTGCSANGIADSKSEREEALEGPACCRARRQPDASA